MSLCVWRKWRPLVTSFNMAVTWRQEMTDGEAETRGGGGDGEVRTMEYLPSSTWMGSDGGAMGRETSEGGNMNYKMQIGVERAGGKVTEA